MGNEYADHMKSEREGGVEFKALHYSAYADPQITPERLRELSEFYPCIPSGLEYDRDAAEATDMRKGLALAAAEIERLQAEVAVRDRALAAAMEWIEHYQDELRSAGWGCELTDTDKIRERCVEQARAEIPKKQEAHR